MTRTDRRTLVRQLADEGLSQRQIAVRLGISKDTVRRDLRQDVRQPEQDSAAGQAPDEPQDPPQGAPGDAPAPGPGAPPETVAHPVAQGGARLVLELDQMPRLAADLAVLARSGWSAVDVLGRAVGAVADAYRLALREGLIDEGVPFFLPPIELRPAPWLRRSA